MATPLTKATGSSSRQWHCSWRLGTRRGIFSLCLLSVLLLMIVLTVEFGDDDDDGDGGVARSQTGISGSYDDLDDGTRGSGGLDEFWGLGQQGQGRYCRERGQLAVCRPPDAVIIAEGDLGARLSSICAAAALLPAANLTTLALWVPDAFMPHIRFSYLFTLAPAAASGNPASGNPASGNPASGNPASGNPASGASGIPPPPADVEGRALRAAAGEAGESGEGLSNGGREGSGGGAELGNATGRGTGANNSSSGGTGGSGSSSSSGGGGGGGGGGSKVGGAARFVWVEEVNETAAHWREFLALTHRPVRYDERPLITMKGCKGVHCGATVSSLTRSLYLSPASINWLVDAVNPCAFERRMAACMAALQPAPPVAELLLQEDLGRLKSALALYLDDLSLDGCPGCPISATSSPHLCATRRVAMSFLKRPSLDFALAARTALNAGRISDAFHPARAPFVLRATQSRAATSGGNGTEVGNGAEVRQLLIKQKLSPDDLMLCVRLQAVELFALGMTRGLISLKGGFASPQAMFIAAHGAARSDLFRVQRPVCDSPPLLPLTKQKLARFTIIEESLKLVYCAIPKVACNSWLMWLRARLGLPNPEDPLLALNEKEWGLHELALDFTEEQAIRLMTRPDFFKFTFVRNPFSRIASAYSNKLVRTDRPKLKTGTGWGTRQYWSNAFFHAVKPMYEAVKDSTGLVSFPDFVRLVGKLLASHRADMDRHLAPQEDICALSSIKYDFVGRFEHLEEDVKTVVDRFGGEHLDVFRFGKGAHFTDTDRRLAKLYDKDTYERVKKIYAMDFYIAMNNITHETPRALYEIVHEACHVIVAVISAAGAVGREEDILRGHSAGAEPDRAVLTAVHESEGGCVHPAIPGQDRTRLHQTRVAEAGGAESGLLPVLPHAPAPQGPD
ncbi:unnamed protein product [Closterium sp. Yama58-4]|nr:unnamed protein product [Closterium sp. Yama58-4]